MEHAVANKPELNMWFDYTCPHSHLGITLIKSLSEELDLVINCLPYLLRPSAPLQNFASDNHSDISRPQLGQPLRSTNQTLIEPFSSRQLSTVLVHEATAFATTQLKFLEFYEAVAKEYWDHGGDIGSLYLIRKATVQAGLSWEAMWNELSTGSFRTWVLDQHHLATSRGIKTIPSYLIGEKLLEGNLQRTDLESAIIKTQSKI